MAEMQPSSREPNNPKNEVQVGQNAHVDQIAAGENIEQLHIETKHYIENLTIGVSPVWVFVFFILLVGIAFSYWLVTSYQNRPSKMVGVFNIAIAEFGTIDENQNVTQWNDGAALAEAMGIRIEGEFSGIPILKPIVDIRYKDVGIIQGKTSAERADYARQTAENLNAQLLIYGNLEKRDSHTIFQPEFYIKDLKGAEELIGPNQLGSSINQDSATTGIARNLSITDALDARAKALIYFTVGLAYLSLQSPDKAIPFFTSAEQVQGWDDREGKEVIHLFLGTSYFERRESGDVEHAREEYARALQINPEYARAYIGLGNTYYAEVAPLGKVDLGKLLLARQQYERAMTAKDKTDSAYVDAKIHINLGTVYLVTAQTEDPKRFTDAESEFQAVVNPYETGHHELEPFAAMAYFGLGAIQERRDKNYLQASIYYSSSIRLANEGSSLRQQAQDQLKVIEKRLTSTPP